MSIDRLQEKIRKQKNPSVAALAPAPEAVPPGMEGLGAYYHGLLEALKGLVPAVRFSFGGYSLLGQEGLALLQTLLTYARKQEFYVILDAPAALSAQEAQQNAARLMAPECPWPWDALTVSAYIGGDALRPYVQALPDSGKAVFAVLRTANRSAPEVQDLLTGSRLVHTALADTVYRMAEPLLGRCGYCQVAAVASATAPDSLKALRAKYKSLFLLAEGYDCPGGNGKNCAYIFDRLGHGGAVCAGSAITAAWTEEDAQGGAVELAVQAAQRMKRNLSRYVTVL